MDMGQSQQRYGQPGELWVLSQPELEDLGVSYTRVVASSQRKMKEWKR